MVDSIAFLADFVCWVGWSSFAIWTFFRSNLNLIQGQHRLPIPLPSLNSAVSSQSKWIFITSISGFPMEGIPLSVVFGGICLMLWVKSQCGGIPKIRGLRWGWSQVLLPSHFGNLWAFTHIIQHCSSWWSWGIGGGAFLLLLLKSGRDLVPIK
jgi:hypothetical protein